VAEDADRILASHRRKQPSGCAIKKDRGGFNSMAERQLRYVKSQGAGKREFIRFVVCASLALGLAGVAKAHAQDNPQALAQKAAAEWLALLDAGKYGESWDVADQTFKQVFTRKDWESKLKARAALGKNISRKVTKSELLKDPPHGPPGEYVAIRYQSSFENLQSAVELVIPKLNEDGKWRVSNYLIRAAE
jgi:Protein of unknown function (DUF4019)